MNHFDGFKRLKSNTCKSNLLPDIYNIFISYLLGFTLYVHYCKIQTTGA